MKLANYVMAAAFLFSVIVQYNDPDPLAWMAMYGAALVACVLFALRRMPWWLPAGVGVIALLWAIDWAPGVLGKTRFSEMFEAWEMKNERVEEAREFWGLMIIAGWMAVLSVLTSRRTSSPRQ